jgi:hypothetical protein
MHNHRLLGRCRMLFFGAALSFMGMGMGMGAVTGCQGSTTNNDPNYHPVDSRRSMGNPAVGALCDDKHVCAPDSKNQTPACLTAHLYDTVGFCAPACSTDSDCDTYLPGLPKCTNMGSSPQCVLFCDQQHVNTSKACPDMWSCELVQGPQQSFYMCVPPQTQLTTTTDM